MDLVKLRHEIDQIDNELIRLFTRRMDIVFDVAKYKQATGMAVFDRSREREILSRIAEAAGAKYENYAKLLYSAIFEMSRSYQNQMLTQPTQLVEDIRAAIERTPKTFPAKAKVACQGVEGAYSQQAADRLFSLADIKYVNSFEDVFRAVQSGECSYGMLPVENSTAGTVTLVYDLMKRYRFYIVHTVKYKIEHSLLAKKSVKFEDIREIVSHEQALSQCSEFFKAHPEIKATVFENTATAAKYVAESGRVDIAAIASPDCMQLYGLTNLGEKVQNSDHNYTRFICISKQMEIYPGANKISLMLTVAHKPGSLYSMIARFASLGMNLTKLESRPIPGKDFEFMFYFDVETSIYSPETVALLGQLDSELDTFVFLGSYCEIV